MFDYNDPGLDELCTAHQLKVLQTKRELGSNSKAARALGTTPENVKSALSKIRRKYNRRVTDPHDASRHHTVPEGYHIKGVSTMTTSADGRPMWVKTAEDAIKQQQAMEAAATAYMEGLPKVDPKPMPIGNFDKDLIPWYNIGDGHIGMLAHDQEVGHNFDLKIAETELCEGMGLLIDRAPKTERGVVQDMGDMSHYENIDGVTSASGHALDFDTRFPKMIKVYTRTMLFVVEKALTKHKYVDVIVNQGNHSRVNDHWMAVMLRTIYANEPRVHVLDNDSIFIPYRMGNTFVMSHHSDKCKGVKLAGVMANDFAQDWGETKYHYIDIGHVHHKSVVKEDNGAIIESFNQLAPMDKYAHDGGWRSRQMLTVVLRSKTYGETGRMVITGEEVKDRLMKLSPGTTAQKRRKVYSV